MAKSIIFYSTVYQANLEFFLNGNRIVKAMWLDTGEYLTQSQRNTASNEYDDIVTNRINVHEDALYLGDPDEYEFNPSGDFE